MTRRSLGWSAVLAFVPAAHAFAVTLLFGVEPGRSTRAEAETVFGAPVRAINESLFEYAPQGGSGPILIEFRTGSTVVERIEVQFVPPLARALGFKQLNLPEIADGSRRAADGSVTEYFGGSRSLVVGSTPDGGITSVGYYSRELFDRTVADLNLAGKETPPSTAVRMSNAADQPLIQQFNPAACRDLYYWADKEYEAARASRNVARRQMSLDIRITAQRGDCHKAQELAERYKQQFGVR